MSSSRPDVMDKLVSLCKRHGFIFQSSEIYGGTGSVWDYGPLGVELKTQHQGSTGGSAMVRSRDDIEGLDAAILMHPAGVGGERARGGLHRSAGGLQDVQGPVPGRSAGRGALPAEAEQAARRGEACELTAPRHFNLMFKTFMGPVEESASVVYLRPETAQGIYVNFLNVQQSTRQKVPFGIAQIGKAFRNEITPGNFIFRTREFEQMEMQFFVEPGTDMDVVRTLEGGADGVASCRWVSMPSGSGSIEHTKEELAHYARAAYDVQFDFGGTLGFQEIEGVHNRGDFDLMRHQEYSGKKLEYFDQPNESPVSYQYVIETSVGADRVTLAVLVNAYREETGQGETRAARCSASIRRWPRSRPACFRS